MSTKYSCVLSAAVLFVPALAVAQTVRVINMVPAAQSAETSQDSEPDITVNPNNPSEVVASAFTPNPSGSTTSAPIYLSSDAGNTWALNNIVPSGNGMTGDITVALSRSNVLYAGILHGGSSLQMRILRSATYTAAGTMTGLLTRSSIDQPYTRSTTALIGAPEDRLYVGNNDFGATPQSASLEQSLSAAAAPAPAGLGTVRLDARVPPSNDGPPIRPAAHPDGTVYAVFNHWTTAWAGTGATSSVVVVRDDDFGQGPSPFTNLVDSADSIAGQRVITGINITWASPGLGQERIGDKLAIAVDPRNSDTVYVVFYDSPATPSGSRLRVRRSGNRGQSWSGDLLSIDSATNPTLAVTMRGRVGFLYQQLAGSGATQTWATHLRTSIDSGASWDDRTLANAPAATPVRTFFPYLGDYTGLAAVGKDLYGAFSASNAPSLTNFPSGVTYQRNANFTTNTLLNVAGTSAVNVSIDPFFFELEAIPDSADYYVRDWTDSASARDIGLEPSTDPVFYDTSDVWNRRSNAPGGFNASDQPQSEDPQVSALGNNWGFARVHRKATGSAQTVNLKFLKSEYGTGSNYVLASATPTTTLAFGAADSVQTLTSGVEWTLNATDSIHTCIAVEIDTPTDVLAGPSLVGRAPGWPTTDLMVLNDNNVAQRNMGVHATGAAGMSISYYAVVHNPALYTRDVELLIHPSTAFRKHQERVVTKVLGGKGELKGDRWTLPAMAPGENRWLELTVPSLAGKGDELLAVDFIEVERNMPINGFTLATRPTTLVEAMPEAVSLYAQALLRLGAMRGSKLAQSEGAALAELLKSPQPLVEATVELMSKRIAQHRKALSVMFESDKADPFAVGAAFEALEAATATKKPEAVLPALANAAQKLDAWLTMFDKRGGDLADLLQTARLQLELIEQRKKLSSVAGAQDMIAKTRAFVREFDGSAKSVAGYTRLLRALLPGLAQLSTASGANAAAELGSVRATLSDARRSQAAHRALLLKLMASD